MTTVYETVRVMNGRLPLWQRHLERLMANSQSAGLEAPTGVEEAVHAAVGADPQDHQLRVTWDGRSLDVQHRPLPSLEPFTVKTVSVRHEGYRIKTTDRNVFERARAEARAAGADEGLLLTEEGFVAEGTLFAVGWISSGTLCVPSLDLGILPSVGRARVIEVAGELTLPVSEGRFPRSALDGRAVFATTATRGVVRIARLDDREVPTDQWIDRLAKRFWPP